ARRRCRARRRPPRGGAAPPHPPPAAPPPGGTGAPGPPIPGTGEGAAHRTAATGMAAADVSGAPDDLGRTPGGPAGGPAAARKAPPPRRRALAGWAICLALALLLAFGIRAFVVQAFSIPSTSMLPTLDVGDRILVQKAFFNWHQVREGDIVVFTHPPRDHCGGPAGTHLVKPGLALPGQTISPAPPLRRAGAPPLRRAPPPPPRRGAAAPRPTPPPPHPARPADTRCHPARPISRPARGVLCDG